MKSSRPPQQTPERRKQASHHHKAAPTGPYWMYGRHAIIAALQNQSRQCLKLLALEAPDVDLESLLRHRPGKLPVEIVTREVLQRLLPGDAVHQGLAMQVRPLDQPALEDVIRDGATPACLVVLDQVTDPHNVGAILRSAAAFGAKALLVTERHAAPENGALAKAASGALDILPIVAVGNLARALQNLKEAGFWCAGLAAESSNDLAATALPDRLAVIMGAEGTGLRRLTRDHCDLMLRLPTQENFGQLNVSNAAAIALYEFVRQHREKIIS